MFRLTQSLKVASRKTNAVWVVPDGFVHEDEEGTWLQLRWTVHPLCKLFVEEFKKPLTNTPGIRLLYEKRNAALTEALVERTLFDSSEDEGAAAAPKRRAVRAAPVFQKLCGCAFDGKHQD